MAFYTNRHNEYNRPRNTMWQCCRSHNYKKRSTFLASFFFCIATRQHKIAELTCLGDSTHIPKKHTHYNVHTRVRYTCMSRIRQSHTRLLLQMSYVKYSAVTVRVRLSLLQFINMYMGIDKLGVVYLCHSSQALNASPRVHLDMYVLENNLKH